MDFKTYKFTLAFAALTMLPSLGYIYYKYHAWIFFGADISVDHIMAAFMFAVLTGCLAGAISVLEGEL